MNLEITYNPNDYHVNSTFRVYLYVFTLFLRQGYVQINQGLMKHFDVLKHYIVGNLD